MNTIDDTAVLEKPGTCACLPAEATAQLQRELTDLPRFRRFLTVPVRNSPTG